MAKPFVSVPGPRHSKVVVWLNKEGFSVQICPPRYKDSDGHWKDSNGFYPIDLPSLQHAIGRALKAVDAHEDAKVLAKVDDGGGQEFQ